MLTVSRSMCWGSRSRVSGCAMWTGGDVLLWWWWYGRVGSATTGERRATQRSRDSTSNRFRRPKRLQAENGGGCFKGIVLNVGDERILARSNEMRPREVQVSAPSGIPRTSNPGISCP